MKKFFVQWYILTSRNWQVMLADRANCLMSGLLAPLIALFICLTFTGMEKDNAATDYFARAAHHLIRVKEEKGDDSIREREFIEAVRQATEADHESISDLGAQRRAAIYFVLVSAAVWCGIAGACKEIVNEQPVLYRESHIGVSLLPYLLAKFVVQSCLVGCQTGLLCAITAPWLLGFGLAAGLKLWLLLWLGSTAAVGLGLLISAVSPTLRVALTVVPLIMMAQLILGGLLRPAAQERDTNPMRNTLSTLTIQRWAFEATLMTDKYAAGGVTVLQFGTWDIRGRHGEFNVLTNHQESVVARFFDESALSVTTPVAFHLERRYVPVLVLILLTLVELTSGYLVLRHRFR